MASIELKPCPFCGAEAESTPNTRFNWQVFCTNDSCFMNTITMYDMDTEENAAKAWNKRALEAESARWIDIDAGTLNSRNPSLWQNKSEVTDEAVCAVAQYLLQEDKSLLFNHKGKRYRLFVQEFPDAEKIIKNKEVSKSQ